MEWMNIHKRGNEKYFSLPSTYPCNQSNDITIGDLQTLTNCVERLEGQQSNSSSASDIYFLTMNDSFAHNGQNIKEIYMKVFITSVVGDTDKKIKLYQELLYEYLVYLTKIKKLVNLNLSPFFINVLGGNLRIPSTVLTDFVKLHSGIDEDTIKYNFTRNIKFIINQEPKRPSITDNTKSSICSIYDRNSILTNFTYGYIMTKRENDSVTLDDWIWKYKNTSHLEVDSSPETINDILLVLFQTGLACRAMNLSKLAHNDLHFGNIFIQTNTSLKPFLFVRNDKTYTVNSNIRVFLYDFDRAYMEKINNPILEDPYFHQFSQTNNLISIRDFIKILIYICKDKYTKTIKANTYFNEILADCLYDPRYSQEQKLKKWQDFLVSHDHFLVSKKTRQPMNDPNDFQDFDTLDNIIDKIYSKLIDSAKTIDLEQDYDLYMLNDNFFNQDGVILEKQIENYKTSQLKELFKSTLTK